MLRPVCSVIPDGCWTVRSSRQWRRLPAASPFRPPYPSAPAAAAPAAPAAVSGSIDTDDFPLTDGQQQALHRYMTAYYTTLGDLTEPSTDGVFCADDIAAYEQAVGNDPSQSRPGMVLCILGWK